MLYVMRHGQTDWNKIHRLQGQTDIELNDEGRAQARDARAQIEGVTFDVCFASPLKRAQETAHIILEGTDTPILLDDRLKERNFGGYEGFQNIRQHPEVPGNRIFTDPVNYVPENGVESMEHLISRTGDCFREAVKPLLDNGKNVLVVCHGGSSRAFIMNAVPFPMEEYWTGGLKNCEIRKVLD